jgi:phage terminase large subunit
VDSRERLRQLGQLDLGAWVQAATGADLWSIQQRIGAATSKRRARVAVPSCNASGKTWLAARLALAFYDAYTPGTPCAGCGGPCRGCKVLTTSSKAEHLRDALWAEMRMALVQLEARGITLPGVMSRGQVLRLEEGPNHFIVGHSANKAEGFQGFHAAHKLILGDEATSLDVEMQQAITGLLATGDSRLLLIFNPTTDDTYAAMEARSKRTEVIKITAYDTPHFTGEVVPEGSNLTQPEWLDELKDKGMGPGTYEWTTRVLADFWTQGDDVLISPDNFDKATATPHVSGTRQLGIDLAPYGSDENVIAFRDGNALVKLLAFPAMRQDLFWEGPVTDAVRSFAPDYLTWDADGVGSGVYGEADKVADRFNASGGNLILLPFRGGVKVDSKFNNARSAWWWNLRRRFEAGTIALTLPPDQKLRTQAIDIRYSVTAAGDIKVEPKDQMKRRGTESPDRGDAVMYAFSMTDELPVPSKIIDMPVTDHAGVKDRSSAAMWRKDLDHLKRRRSSGDPWTRLRQGQQSWDDL